MRIGLSCTTLEPAITQGQIDGIGFYTKNLLEQFLLKNKNVLPYSFPPLKNPRISSGLENGKIFKLPYMSATIVSLITPKIISLYPYLEKEIDIFHATDHLVPKLKNTPVIATLNDGLMLTHPHWYSGRFRKLKNTIRIKSLGWADHVITISQAMMSETIEYWGIKPEKISVIHLGVSDYWLTALDEPTKMQTLKKLGIPEKFLLVVGTLQPKKNISRIIHAYLKLSDTIKKEYPLVIAGKAGWNTDESLTAIQMLIESKFGFWLKYVADEDLRALFQSASLYLHPSLHEGFGLTILQGFASRVPVLTSNITAMPEIAGDAAHLVDPYSEEDIKNSLFKMLTTPDYTRELVKRGIDRAKTFSWKNCAEKTLNLYQKIIMSA